MDQPNRGGRPRVEHPKQHLAVLAHPLWIAALKRHAKRKGIKYSSLVRDALAAYMEAEGIEVVA